MGRFWCRLRAAAGGRGRWIAVASVLAVAVPVLVVFLPTGASASGGCATGTRYSNAVLNTTGLVGYWRLGDASGTTACDAKGANPGTYQSGTTLGRAGAIAGDSDAATGFDGTSGSISVPAATSLDVGDKFTIEAWVKRGSVGGTANQVIASKQGSAWTLMFNPSNKLVLHQSGGADIVASTTTVSDTTSWHQVVATKTGSTVKLYIDGKDATGSVTNKTLSNSTLPLAIGQTASSSYFNGTLDEVALYNASLTANQVANHYLLGTASCTATSSNYARTVAQTSGLAGFWRLGESTGATACDSSGVNPGSYQGGYTLARSGAINGDPDSATLFNGSSGWISVPALTSLDVGDTFTFEAWVKRGTVGGSTSQVIASKQGSAWTVLFNTTNQLVLQAGTKKITTSTAALSDTSNWHYVAVTKGGTTVHLYLDGTDVTGSVTNVTLANSTSPLAIAQSGASASWFNGTIDEPALYTAALTATQIQSHYSLGASPGNTSPPTISGQPTDGQTLTATNGTWSGATSYAYQWQTCDSSAGNCQDIAGATSSTHSLAAGDVGLTERVVVTATNSVGSTQATSQPTSVVQAQAPQNTTAPAISGTATDGQTLTASHGTWTGTSPSYAYQWRRCDAQGSSCQDIGGATSSTYGLGASDVGTTVRVVVTASNSAGSAQAASDPTAVVQAMAPQNTTAPAISGTATDGQTLTASPGSWTGTSPSYADQWQRCDDSGTNCQDIAGATSSRYTLGAGDVGSTIRVVVTAANAAGSVQAASQATGVVQAQAPQNTTAPSISGSPTDGETLSASRGAWSGTAPTYTYQWQSCDAQGANCADVQGATASTYTLAAGDVGTTLRVLVTAANSAGSAQAGSQQTPVVQALAPQNTNAPSISGTATDGQTLTGSRGTWSGTAPSYAYQWQRCDNSGTNCQDIASATSSTYTLTAADVGNTLRVAVTATNSAGSVQASSQPTDVVQALAPQNTSAPTISGNAVDGQTLTTSPGTWTGTSPTYAYQWQSCDTQGANCADIQGATGSTYTLGAGDIGTAIRVVATAANSAGSAQSASQATATVQGVAPQNTAPPTVSGTAIEGESLSATTGTWSGASLGYAYQWQSCDSTGAGCSDIQGATGSTYTLGAGDIGTTLRVVVTATNAAGSTAAASQPTDVVAAAGLAATTLPLIDGTTTVGETLSTSTGVWSEPVTGFRYQWLRCDSSGAACSVIAGAGASHYVLAAADTGGTVRVRVSATTPGGTTADATSDQTDTVASLVVPASSTPPTISGAAVENATLSADPGDWSDATDFTYQWQSCDSSGGNCSDIYGATSSEYVLTSSEVDATLRVEVAAAGPGGTANAVSEPSDVVSTPGAPSNVDLPTIAGQAAEASQLVAGAGAWDGSPDYFSYQWQRCDQNSSSCTDISGATDSTYTPVTADVGATLQVVVTASGSGGDTATTSQSTDPVAAAGAPTNTTSPAITGRASRGMTLQASPGSWTPSSTYTYQWQACDPNGTDCSPIAGATGTSYLLTESEVGSTVRVAVTATGPGGVGTAYSAATATVAEPTPPVNVSPPTVAGSSLAPGESVYGWAGTWGGDYLPGSNQYQWQRCDSSGNNCIDIAGATDAWYYLSSDDAGSTVRVAVTAGGPGGTTAAASAPTGLVQAPAAPSNSTAPSLTGDTVEGGTLHLDLGDWSGSPTYSVQWQHCDTSGSSCTDFWPGAYDSLTLTASDVGTTIRAVVTASNDGGQSSAASNPSATVTAAVTPANTTPPTITGSAVEGETVQATEGSWTGSKSQFAYQWQSCDGDGANCASIAGATSASYALGIGDVGTTVRVVVTATNPAGAISATSDPTATVTGETTPDNSVPPSISGDAVDGQALSVDAGSWAGGGVQLSYQWENCDNSGGDCSDLVGASDATYVLDGGDVGTTIRVSVTASNSTGSTTVTSDATEEVQALPAPTSLAPPQISGSPQAGETINADNGSWTDPQPDDYAYQWQRCDAGGASCQPIDGATEAGYDVSTDDIGSTLRAAVTANNSGGGTTATSDPTAVVADAARSVIDPAGEKIAFVSDSTLWVASDNGAPAEPVCGTGVFQSCDYDYPTISPDGRRLAAYDYADNGLVVMNLDGTNRHEIGTGYWGERPAWSPDGKTIAAPGPLDGPWGTGMAIYSYDADALSPQTPKATVELPATPEDADDWVDTPDYSPDGTQIAYYQSGERDGGYQNGIFVANADGTDPHAVVNRSDMSATNPKWSPDGTQIVFDNNGSGVYVANADGSDLRRLTTSGDHPSWSPDGRTIMFENGGLWAMNADGSSLRPLSTGNVSGYDGSYRKGTLPNIHLAGTPPYDQYTNGQSPLQLTVAATDRGSGIGQLSVEDSTGSAVGEANADCQSGCPLALKRSIDIATDGMSEGTYDFGAHATNADGTDASQPFELTVDRTAPDTPSGLTATYDPDTQATTVAWQSNDPPLSNGADGSGIAGGSYRYERSDGTWTDWADTTDDSFELTDANPGDSVNVEVKSVDKAGNESPVYRGVAAPPLGASDDCTTLYAPIGGHRPSTHGRYALSDENGYNGERTFGEGTPPAPGDPVNAAKLGVQHVRLIVAWNLITQAKAQPQPDSSACIRYKRVYNWIAYVKSLGMDVLISFNYPDGTNGGRSTQPNATKYRKAVSSFVHEFPYVGYYTAFNEPNNNVFPRVSDADDAGKLWSVLNDVCRSTSPRCQVGAGDFSDGGGFTSSYWKTYQRAMHGRAPWWAVHAYSAIENCDSASHCKTSKLNAFLGWKPVDQTGRLWITEAGSPLYTKKGQVPGGEATQAARLSNLFRSPFYTHNLHQIQRFYYYLWHEDAPQPPAGSGKAGIPDWGLAEYDRSRTRQIYCTYMAKTAPGAPCP